MTNIQIVLMSSIFIAITVNMFFILCSIRSQNQSILIMKEITYKNSQQIIEMTFLINQNKNKCDVFFDHLNKCPQSTEEILMSMNEIAMKERE